MIRLFGEDLYPIFVKNETLCDLSHVNGWLPIQRIVMIKSILNIVLQHRQGPINECFGADWPHYLEWELNGRHCPTHGDDVIEVSDVV